MSEFTWNYEEFVCFTLLYASHVDIEFTEDERKRIMTKCSEETYQKMWPIFDQMSDFAALEEILKYKPIYYPTEAQKRELLNKIKGQFFVDGEYTAMERELFHFLEKTM